MKPKFYFDRPVLGKLLILPRSSAAQFTYAEPWACISIASSEKEFPKISEENRIDLLRLVFEDLDAIPGPDFSKAFPEKVKNLFTKEHANEVLDFLCENWKKVKLLMIHCYAGQSRSAAVGLFVCENLQSGWLTIYKEIFKMPNKMVYSILKEEFVKSFETYTHDDS